MNINVLCGIHAIWANGNNRQSPGDMIGRSRTYIYLLNFFKTKPSKYGISWTAAKQQCQKATPWILASSGFPHNPNKTIQRGKFGSILKEFEQNWFELYATSPTSPPMWDQVLCQTAQSVGMPVSNGDIECYSLHHQWQSSIVFETQNSQAWPFLELLCLLYAQTTVWKITAIDAMSMQSLMILRQLVVTGETLTEFDNFDFACAVFFCA